MFNSVVLDVAIGLVFIYLTLALMCTTANEWIAQLFDMRATTLKEGINNLLQSPPADAASFHADDINPIKLHALLTSTEGKLASAIGLDPASVPAVISPESAELPAVRSALASRLNQALGDVLLYQKIDVTKVSPSTLKQAQKQPAGPALAIANAALLREAYPEALGSLALALFKHPLIQSLSRNGKIPSYIPGSTFAAAMTDILGDRQSLEAVRLAIASLPESPAKRALTILAAKPGATLDDVEQSIQDWFDQAMERVSGWYKRKAQVVTVIVAACITMWANADTVGISRKLFLTPAIRQKILQDSAAKSTTLTSDQKADLGGFTGWSEEFTVFHRLKSGNPQAQPDDSFPGMDLIQSPRLFLTWLWAVIPGHLLGWILTAMAVSLGAPFWFDTLNKFMNIRAAGAVPGEKDKSKA